MSETKDFQTIHIPEAIHRDLKRLAAEKRLKLRDIAAMLLEDQLKRIKRGEVKLIPAVIEPGA